MKHLSRRVAYEDHTDLNKGPQIWQFITANRNFPKYLQYVGNTEREREDGAHDAFLDFALFFFEHEPSRRNNCLKMVKDEKNHNLKKLNYRQK